MNTNFRLDEALTCPPWLIEVQLHGLRLSYEIFGPWRSFTSNFDPDIYDYEWAIPIPLPRTRAEERALIEITKIVIDRALAVPNVDAWLRRACARVLDESFLDGVPAEIAPEVLWGGITQEGDHLLQSLHLRSGWLLDVLTELVVTYARWQDLQSRNPLARTSFELQYGNAIADELNRFADQIRKRVNLNHDPSDEFRDVVDVVAKLRKRLSMVTLPKGKVAPKSDAKALALFLRRVGEGDSPFTEPQIAARLFPDHLNGVRRVQQSLREAEIILGIEHEFLKADNNSLDTPSISAPSSKYGETEKVKGNSGARATSGRT